MKEVLTQGGEILGAAPDGLLEAIHAAHESRQQYLEAKRALSEHAEQLRGREGLLSGQLSGRHGTTVYSSDPEGTVERLHVLVASARVEDYNATPYQRDAPYIAITARTMEGRELICANLNQNGSSIELLPMSENQAE